MTGNAGDSLPTSIGCKAHPATAPAGKHTEGRGLAMSRILAAQAARRLSRAGPVEGDVLARIRRPLKFVAERIDGADRGLAPSHQLWAGSCFAAGRVHELRIFSWQARRSRQRLGPSRHLADDLDSPVGDIWRDLERDPGTLDSDNFSLVH